MTNWVQMNGKDIEWQIGTQFSTDEGGSVTTTWEIKEILNNGDIFFLTLPNKNNETNYTLSHYPSSGIKKSTYWFKVDTIQKLDPMLKIINKIKYLNKRYLDRQAKKVLT